MKKLLLVPALCLTLSLLLTGCSGKTAGNTVSNAASKAGDTISKAGEDVSRNESRMESDLNSNLDNDLNSSSRLPNDDNSHTGSTVNGDRDNSTGDVEDVPGIISAESGVSSNLS